MGEGSYRNTERSGERMQDSEELKDSWTNEKIPTRCSDETMERNEERTLFAKEGGLLLPPC
jgi:hypothetical protein